MPFSRSRSPESSDALGHLGADPEGARLPEHGVDKRGLAVVDVRHDRHVAQVVAGREDDQRTRPRWALRRLRHGWRMQDWQAWRKGSGNCGKRRDYGLH